MRVPNASGSSSTTSWQEELVEHPMSEQPNLGDIEGAHSVKKTLKTSPLLSTSMLRLMDVIPSFASGSKITCPAYYSMANTMLTEATMFDDPSMDLGFDGTSMICVKNTVIRLAGSFTAENTEDGVVIRNQGVIVGGLIPKIGDEFLYSLEPDITHRFKITESQETTFRSNPCYNIAMQCIGILTAEQMLQYKEATVDTVEYHENASGGYITTEEHEMRRVLRASYDVLVIEYLTSFKNPMFSMILHPKGKFYDQYLALFLSHIIPVTMSGNLAINISVNDAVWKQTIWAHLLGQSVMSATDGSMLYLKTKFEPVSNDKVKHIESVNLSPLIRIQHVAFSSSDEAKSYVFSEAFYSGETDSMSEWESFVYKAVHDDIRDDLATLVQYIANAEGLSSTDKFYQIPILLWMIRTYM